MSSGEFQIEDQDIARLDRTDGNESRTGWVNVGTHAIYIQLDAAGNLVVEVNARTNEGGSLGTITVTSEASVSHGGIDPQASDE